MHALIDNRKTRDERIGDQLGFLGVEEALQKKIEEQFVQIRHEQAEKQALQFEVKKMRALVEEKDVVLR